MESFLWFILMGLVIGWLAGLLGIRAYISLGSFLVDLLGLIRLIQERSPP